MTPGRQEEISLWIEQCRRLPLEPLVRALRLTVRHQSFAPCPACGAEKRSSSDRRPPVNMIDHGTAWHCWACDTGGDAIALVRSVLGGGTVAEWDEVRAWFADRGYCAPAGLEPARPPSSGPRSPLGRDASSNLPPSSRTASTAPAQKAGSVVGSAREPQSQALPRLATTPENDGPAGYGSTPEQDAPLRPPRAEVEALWQACTSLNELEPATHGELLSFLQQRGYDPAVLAAEDVARALPASYRWPEWWPQAWSSTWQLVVPAFEPDGTLASLHARAVVPVEKGTPKTRWPRVGHGSATGLFFADHPAQALLRGEPPTGVRGVLICEGLTDYLTAICQVETYRIPLVVLSGTSGSFPALTKARWPEGLTFYCATDVGDPKGTGDRYALEIADALGPRPVYRLPLPPGDLSDAVQQGTTLPALLEAALQHPIAMSPDKQVELEQSDPRLRLEKLAPRLDKFLEPSLQRMYRRATRQEKPIPLEWPALARTLGGGLWPGLGVVVGNTKSGKSQFALQIALHAARQGTPVLYIPLELGEMDLSARLVGLHSGKKWSRLFLGNDYQNDSDRDQEWADIYTRYLPELNELPFHIQFADAHGWTYRDLQTACEAMRACYPDNGQPGSVPFLVIVDFLQIVDTPEWESLDLRERIGRTAYAGRIAARKHDASILMISSTARNYYKLLNGREPESPPGKAPLEDFQGIGKESGEVEYSCDLLVAICRPTREQDEAVKTGERFLRWIAVSAMRAGPPAWIPLMFDGSRFYEPDNATQEKLQVALDKTNTRAPKGVRTESPPPEPPLTQLKGNRFNDFFGKD